MTTQSGLWDNIYGAKVSSEYPYKTEFWPEGSLRKITENDITMELYGYTTNQVGNTFDDELVQFILRDATKLLAACFLSQVRNSYLKQTMSVFRKLGFSDRFLPLNEGVISQNAGRLQWNRPQTVTFLQYQWKFVAQKFSRSHCLVPYPLKTEIILPFTQVSPSGEGNFGAVYKVTVHPSHFDRDDPIHQVRHQYPHSSVVSFSFFFFLYFPSRFHTRFDPSRKVD